jgi:hypothetical protein
VASSYQIGTLAVGVEVFMASGPSIAGEMFLRPGRVESVRGVGAAETVAERLNDGSPFFPLKAKANGAVLLLGKAQVRYVVTPSLDDDDDVADGRSSIPQLLVTAELDTGEAITGVFFVDLPPGHVRSLDYVNESKREFVALAQLDREYLINRSFIRQLRDLAGAPDDSPGSG